MFPASPPQPPGEPTFVRVTPGLIRSSHGALYVERAHLFSLHQAHKAVEAHTAVREILKAENDGLRAGNKVLDEAVRALADDRARVEAWEQQFTLDPEQWPGIGWLVRQHFDSEGAVRYIVLCGKADEGEHILGTWREAMDAAIVLTAQDKQKALEAATAALAAEGAGVVP